MPGPRCLVEWPWITVEVECPLCDRAGRYRLARLAERYGAAAGLGPLLVTLAARCKLPKFFERTRQYEARCGVRYRVPPGGPVPDGLPAREVRPDETPPQRRRRRRGPDGPLPTVGESRREGITHVDVHCYGIDRHGVYCHHTARIALADLALPDDLPFAHIGATRRLRCRRCGGARASVAAIWPDSRAIHAKQASDGMPMCEVNGIIVPRYPEPSRSSKHPEQPAVPSTPDLEAYEIVQDDDDTYTVVFAGTGTVVHLDGVPQRGLTLDRADEVADHLEALDRIAAARSTGRLDS